jgi:hypothetical protein
MHPPPHSFSSSLSVDFTYGIFFSTLFTLLPTIYMGVFDQDVNDRISLQVPQLYLKGIMQTMFGMRPYWLLMANAIYQSIIIYYATILAFGEGSISPQGRDHGIDSLDTLTGFAIVFAVNIACTGSTSSLTWIGITSFFLSLVIWLGYVLIYISSSTLALLSNLLTTAVFYFLLPLLLVACLLPMGVAKYVQQTLYPTDTDIIQEVQKYIWRDGYAVRLDRKEEEAAPGLVGKTSLNVAALGSTGSVYQPHAGGLESQLQLAQGSDESSTSVQEGVSVSMSDVSLAPGRQPATAPSESALAPPPSSTATATARSRRPSFNFFHTVDGFGAKQDGHVGPKAPAHAKKEARVRQLSSTAKNSERRTSVTDLIKGSLSKAGEYVKQRLKISTDRHPLAKLHRTSVIHMADGQQMSNTGFAFSQDEGMSSVITPV